MGGRAAAGAGGTSGRGAVAAAAAAAPPAARTVDSPCLSRRHAGAGRGERPVRVPGAVGAGTQPSRSALSGDAVQLRDRKSVVEGKSVSVRVDLGGSRLL